jgi:non-reducing end alpha-L-arabinofuranosidase
MKNKSPFLITLAIVFFLPVAVTIIFMSFTIQNATLPRSEGPCDIYEAAGTPCVAAHSTTRALYKAYNGPLYQVQRQSDSKTLDIGLVSPGDQDPGGYADAKAQDIFCANTLCYITVIYDQSGKGNHLYQAPPGTFKGPAKGGFNNLPIADMAPITISGHKAYGVYIMPGMGLRNNNAAGIAINDEPEGIYYVVNGKHYDNGCCFDYGNSSTNSKAVGTGTMETTYYGNSTAWGSGNNAGPWIMSDMEAGLFSGYDPKKNDVPAIDSWQFVTAVVNGGGGNKWNLRGGNAQKGNLTTFYSGVRPSTPQKNDYFPMNKKGGLLLGNGGDNGNGSAGTFYEGVMTTGYPAEATTDAVQANIVAARYDVQSISLSRTTTFTPKSVQEITETFANTTGASVTNVRLSLVVPKGWTATIAGSNKESSFVNGSVAPGVSVSATFKIISPNIAQAGYLTGKVEWKNSTKNETRSETIAQRIRNAFPVKINEVRFSSGDNATNQFIELYNASSGVVDLSNWYIVNTKSEWAPVTLGTIPTGTKLAPHGFYLLALSTSGLVEPADQGKRTILVRSTAGLNVGQQINIDNEVRKIVQIGTAASPLTTLFIPVSTGPWLTIPAGSTNLPVTDATGFKVGQKIGIDLSGNYEVATVTVVGKAATQTSLSTEAKAGENIIKVAANANMTVGDVLTISTGARKELVKIKRILKVGTLPVRSGFGQAIQAVSSGEAGVVELERPLRLTHMTGVDVSDTGTGISFSPATRYAHKSGDAVQSLGSGITLESALTKHHKVGAPVLGKQITSVGYQGEVAPNLWYSEPLSVSAGSIALMDRSRKVVVDALVYGSQQSNSSANGTITSPDIATLEGVQSQGGRIVVVPAVGRRGFAPTGSTTNQINKSIGRFPDGADSDDNFSDFRLQMTVTPAEPTNDVRSNAVQVPNLVPTPGKPNQY